LFAHLDGRHAYPKRIFIPRIAAASTSVTAFQRMIGGSCFMMPKASQPARPTLNVMNAGSDTSFAERVFQIFTTCGTNATVVRNPAAKPTSDVTSNGYLPILRVRA